MKHPHADTLVQIENRLRAIEESSVIEAWDLSSQIRELAMCIRVVSVAIRFGEPKEKPNEPT